MYISGVKIENFRGIGKETIFKFNPGITVLVGENDSGKSTVIDAIRYVLGTTDQNWYKVEFFDYHNENTEDEIRISICFSDLSLKEKAAFMECLTYTKTGEKLYLNWTAKYMKNVKPNRTLVNLTCGKNGDVSAPSPEARELLRVTYLRPLRDAYAQMRAGRNSRFEIEMQGFSKCEDRFGNYLFLNVINGTEIITQLHDLLYSNEFSAFDLGMPFTPHMTVGKLKTVDELNDAYNSVKDNKTLFKSNITKISVEMIGENEESIIVIEKILP